MYPLFSGVLHTFIKDPGACSIHYSISSLVFYYRVTSHLCMYALCMDLVQALGHGANGDGFQLQYGSSDNEPLHRNFCVLLCIPQNAQELIKPLQNT